MSYDNLLKQICAGDKKFLHLLVWRWYCSLLVYGWWTKFRLGTKNLCSLALLNNEITNTFYVSPWCLILCQEYIN